MHDWRVKSLETEKLPIFPEYPSLVLRLLALRGLTETEQIRDFLDPDYNKLHDPFKFRQMQEACERIRQAIEKGEGVTIYADYDADAITAAAILYLGLKKLGLTADYYIPDRFSEGYGMNSEAIAAIAEKGAKLIVTVDCGINAVEEVAKAKSLGMDVIITDHHELTGDLPEALAVINPKNPHDEYPFPYLTGVGVAFKLVQALFSQMPNTKYQIPPGWDRWLLDLVAIGTVADLQNLTGENRILVSFGLKVLGKTIWPGLKALLAAANAPNKYDTYTLGFIIAPRLNAAGRIRHGDVAFKLLVAENSAEADALAKELNELNSHRQFLTEQVLSDARAQVDLIRDKKVLLVVGSDWPKGVVGLVAGKLAEEYNRPVLAVSTADGVATGSARAGGDFDMVWALASVKDLLQKYGGHKQAAGFTLATENLPDFYQRLLELAESVSLNLGTSILEVDAEVKPADIAWETFEYLEKFAPFGMGNPNPKFLGREFEVLDIRVVGAEGKHAKLKLKFGGHILEAIALGKGFLYNSLKVGRTLDCVFELTANEWNGNKQLQLKILEVKIL